MDSIVGVGQDGITVSENPLVGDNTTETVCNVREYVRGLAVMCEQKDDFVLQVGFQMIETALAGVNGM